MGFVCYSERFSSDVQQGKEWTSDFCFLRRDRVGRLPIWSRRRLFHFNEMPPEPALIYTDGVRGEALGDQLSNRVYWLPAGE